jgi:hypothetical protein
LSAGEKNWCGGWRRKGLGVWKAVRHEGSEP